MSYPSLIQKDLPLITWALDDSAVTTGSAISASNYFTGTQPNGNAYTGTYSSTVTKKAFPIINGSLQTVEIPSTDTVATYVKIPSLDRFSSITKNDSATLEFWIKFVSNVFITSTTIKPIVQKTNSLTGVYIHNSSIIGIVGDNYGNIAKAVVPVQNLKKTMHIAFSYTKNSVTISVNGQSATASINTDVFTNSYSSAEEYFEFKSIQVGLGYALDHIAIYAKALDYATIRRHVAYGLGYEVSQQVAKNYGGIKYNFSSSQTPIVSKLEKGSAATWKNAFSMSNLEIENDILRTAKKFSPKLKSTTSASVSSTWATESSVDYVSIPDGTYYEIEDSSQINSAYSGGIAFIFYRPSADAAVANGVKETLVEISNKANISKYVKFYIEGATGSESIKVSIDGNITTLMTQTTKISGTFTVSYFFDASDNKIYVYAGSDQTVTGVLSYSVLDRQFYSGKITLLSNGNSELEQHCGAGIKKIVNILSKPTTSTAATILSSVDDDVNIINSYSAKANATQKRFIISAQAEYVFKFDMQQICGTNGFVGNHKFEYGCSSSELSIKVEGVNSSGTWMVAQTVSNLSPIATLINRTPGTNNALKFTFTINANDVEENPVKIYFFRMLTYPTILSGSNYNTTLVCNGPDLLLTSTTSQASIMPAPNLTPFLYNEESGNAGVGIKTASISYNATTIRNDTSTNGVSAISFMLKYGSIQTIASITDGTTTYTISSVGVATTLSTTGGTLYVNGETTLTGVTANRWHHIVLVLPSRLEGNISITFGNGTNTVYIDELMVLDELLTSTQVQTLNKNMKNTNISVAGSTDSSTNITNTISIYDSEISNSSSIYQPDFLQNIFNTSVNDAEVNLVSTKEYSLTLVSGNIYSIPYSTLKDIVFDGIAISTGDFILLKNQSDNTKNGIYQVGATTNGVSATLTKQTGITAGTIIFVKEGVQNEKTYYCQTSLNTWNQVYMFKKIQAYSLSNQPTSISSVANNSTTD